MNYNNQSNYHKKAKVKNYQMKVFELWGHRLR